MASIPPFLRCPNCGSEASLNNGTTRRGKQNYQGRDCGRQFVAKPQWQPRAKDRTTLIDRLLLEKLPLAGIARVLKRSAAWLQQDGNQCYKVVPRHVQVTPKPKGTVKVQLDAWWSFGADKGNKPWVWLALNVETRALVGCQIGDRSADSAWALWQLMPAVYRQCAMLDTDYLVTIAVVLASLHSCLETLDCSGFGFTHSNELLKLFPTFQQAARSPICVFGITVGLKGFLGDPRVERGQPSATGRLEPLPQSLLARDASI